MGARASRRSCPLWKEGQEATQQARSAHESAVQQALVSGSVPPQFHTLASVGNAVAHHPEDLLTVAAGAGLMALGGAGMTEGTGISLASGGTLAAGGVPLAVVSAGVAATGATMAGIGTANIMQHATNDDRVTPTHGEGGGGKSGAEIKSELDDLAQGRQEHVRAVRTDEDLQTLYDQWSRGGTSIDNSTYNGSMVELPDGTTVGLREASKSGDRTIDVALPTGRD
jgi:hypothetical protein